MINEKKHGSRFLLINPPYERLKGLSLENVPLGLLYVATALDKDDIKVDVYDADSDFYSGHVEFSNFNRTMMHDLYLKNLQDEDHPAWIEVAHVLEKTRPDFVGVTMLTPVYASCRKLFKIVKQMLPDAKLIVGGPHVTICREEVLESNLDIDYGFVGEAEESIVEFAEAVLTGQGLSSIKGLMYRENGKVIYAGNRERIDTLDRLPIPDRNLLFFKEKYHKRALATMVASRGCPFSCSFCASVPLWGKVVRLRSPENILKEINYLVSEYGIKSFSFWDDTFTSNKKALISFCNLVEKKYGSRKFRWECLTNVNCIDKEVLRHLKKAGCRSIKIGVESGSDRILKMIKKRISTDQVIKVANLIKESGFWLHTYFMVGIPYETEEDIRKTISFIKQIRPDSVNLCTFTPYPGTELYDFVNSREMMPSLNDYRIYDTIGHHSNENFFMENISQKRYLELLDEILTLSSAISRRLTLRKLILKRHVITVERVVHKLRTVFDIWRWGVRGKCRGACT